MPKFTNIGVEAVVANLSSFIRDSNTINKQVQGVAKDLQKMAQASLRGQGAAAKTAQQLSDKYALVAKNARSMATVAASKGFIETAGKLSEQAASAEKLARQYDKVAREARGVTKETGKLRKVSDFVKESWAEIGAAAAIVVAGFQSVKKVFDLGAEGAAVLQTAESFDLLLKKVGVTTDLLGELRTASRNTIDDQTLMSATSLLLAGAGEELAFAMANATPQLLEIAKAANKLNPALGSTAFLYESLSRGIKRNSPLVIDNTGLVIKIGEANKKFADQLGTTVDELTAEQKSMALLNDTLRAGATLIDQAGGNTISATDSFAELDTTVKNLADNLKAKLAPAIIRAAKAANILLTSGDQIKAAFQEQVEVTGKLAPSYEAYVKEIKRAAKVAEIFVLTQEEVNELMGDWRTVEKAASAYVILSEAQLKADRTTDQLQHRQGLLAQKAADVRERMILARDAIEEGAETAATAAPKVNTLADAYGNIDKNLAATITGIRENIAFLAAGGGELQAAAMAVEQAFIDQDIGGKVADEMLQEIGLASLALQEDIGLITPSEAQKVGVEDFGANWGNVVEQIAQAKANIEAIPAEVRKTIQMKIIANVRVILRGMGQGGFQEFQHGGQFTVGGEPGIDRNLVTIRATRGEVVTVTPPGRGGGSTTNNDNRSVNFRDVNNIGQTDAFIFDQQMQNWLGA